MLLLVDFYSEAQKMLKIFCGCLLLLISCSIVLEADEGVVDVRNTILKFIRDVDAAINVFKTSNSSFENIAKDSMSKLGPMGLDHDFEFYTNSQNMNDKLLWLKGFLKRFNRDFDAVTWFLADEGIILPVDISTPCYRDLLDMLSHLAYDDQAQSVSRWSWQMIEAYGEISNGQSLKERNDWMESLNSCISIDVRVRKSMMIGNATDEFLRFFGDYCVVSLQRHLTSNDFLHSEAFDLNYGVCFPSTCSSGDKKHIVNHFAAKFLNRQVIFNEKSCLTAEEKPWNWVTIILTFLIIIPLALVIIGSIYDGWIHFRRQSQYNISPVTESKLNDFGLLICNIFSLRKSYNSIANAPKEDMVPCLDGIRSLAVLAVLSAHIREFQHYQWNSRVYGQNGLQCPAFNSLMQTNVVHSFYFLSGLCLTLSLLKRIKTYKTSLTVSHVYFHRYFRLTVTYVFVVAFTAGPYLYISQGFNWPFQRHRPTDCRRTWWTMFLYVDNLLSDGDHECLRGSWYLDTDMQLFFIAVPLVLLLMRATRRGLYCVITMVIILIINAVYHCNRTSTTLINYWSSLEPGKQWAFSHLHLATASYAGGIFVGFLIDAQRNCQFKITRWMSYCGWLLLMVSLTTTAAFGLLFQRSEHVDELHETIAILLWTMSLAWLVIHSVAVPEGWVNRILSWRIFTFIGSLSYGVFLWQSIVIEMCFSFISEPWLISTNGLILEYLAVTILCISCSSLLYFIVDSPFRRIYNLISTPRELVKSFD